MQACTLTHFHSFAIFKGQNNPSMVKPREGPKKLKVFLENSKFFWKTQGIFGKTQGFANLSWWWLQKKPALLLKLLARAWVIALGSRTPRGVKIKSKMCWRPYLWAECWIVCTSIYLCKGHPGTIHLHMKSSYVYDTEVDKKKEDRRHTSPQFILSFVIDFLAYSPLASFLCMNNGTIFVPSIHQA